MERTNKLYGVAALFDSPDEIIAAAGKTAEAGYVSYDVNTPYPVHGMDDAMKLPPTKLGFVTLAFGLAGALAMLALMTWMMTFDYPMVIGGKPFWPLPAFVPVMFEATVLLATVVTVGAMIAIYFKFPANAHPLHETDYIRGVSKDKFGLLIEAADEKFNELATVEFLQSLGAKKVERIYEPAGEEPPVFTKRFLLLLAGVFVAVGLGTYAILNKALFYTPFDWMSYQPRVNAQAASVFFDDGFGMREPVEGTIARDETIYAYAGREAQPEIPVVNPLAATEENLAEGERLYDVYCSPCHGYHGAAESRLRKQFPLPPSLHTEKARNWEDGAIYHVIHEGQNTMPSYARQLTERDRWRVALYVRALQRAMNASEADVERASEEASDE
jgi:mono/diheme cytochrome c family protein